MDIKLAASLREKSEKLSAEYLPAVLYGKGVKNANLKLKRLDFDKVFAEAGESNLILLDFGSGPVKVLVKDLQRDPLKHRIDHVDFYQVNMKEKINAEIPLHFIGESKAVRELGGLLMKEMDEIEVHCLPGDLVDHLDVDVSILEDFDQTIKTSDLKLPEGMELVQQTDDIVVFVMKPKAIEEEKPVETEAAKSEEAKAEGGEAKKEEK